MAVGRPWLDGWRPVGGSVGLMALRWLAFVAAALPSVAAAIAGLGDGVADRPYFTEAPDPLPVVALGRLIGATSGAVWGTLALASLLVWLGSLLLTAGAVAVLDPASAERPRLRRAIFDAGARSLWAYLRIAVQAAVLAAAGARSLAFVADRLTEVGTTAGWTARTLFLVGLGQVLATLVWLTLVGTAAWWARIIVAAGGRRYTRRLWTLLPRLAWRRPVRAVLLHFLLAALGLLAGSAILFAWRQSAAGPAGWIVLWLLVLAALAFVWHWRLRASLLLWSAPELADLRAVPDEAWRILRRLQERLRRRRAPAARPAEPAAPAAADLGR